MALGIIGDIHGQIHVLSDIVKETVPYDNVVANIQVGDMGIDKSQIKQWRKKKWKFDKPTYFIDGNHEDFDLLLNCSTVTELLPNLFYVPRGTVMELDGRIVAFMGGAASINYKQLLEINAFDLRENIADCDLARFHSNMEKMGNPKVDLLVTHVPPQRIITKYFDGNGRRWEVRKMFGVPYDWEDHNAKITEALWDELGNCDMVCGHMHQNVQFESNSYVMAEFGFRTV